MQLNDQLYPAGTTYNDLSAATDIMVEKLGYQRYDAIDNLDTWDLYCAIIRRLIHLRKEKSNAN